MRRAHSVAIVVVAVLPALVLLFTIDPITPVLVGVVCTAVLLWAAPALPDAVRLQPLVALVAVSAGGAFVANALYGVPGGDTYWQWGFQHITSRSLELAVAQATRAAAIGVPAILMARAISVSGVAAWLALKTAVPARFALATVIGIRLVPIITSDVTETIAARRARGVRVTPLSVTVNVIVVAIRRALRMSEVAEIRGFSNESRVWSAYTPLTGRDALMVALAVCGVIASVAITISSGQWDVLRA